ncbi:TPA: glyoxalase [Candidatus Saccharibacteria bacterium]|nr:glyoxalase [Candidatus Saccharibacteria bacterium]HRK40674.1 VOC family protein [Candidatus Saccharibacteria bacterium]
MFENATTFSGCSVSDLTLARDFYEGKLGCSVEDDSMGLQLRLPGGQSHFLYQKDDHQPAAYTTLNFVVSDIDQVIDELVASGVSMERYDTLPATQDERGVLRGKAAGMGPDIAWFQDPFGNILAVLEA